MSSMSPMTTCSPAAQACEDAYRLSSAQRAAVVDLSISCLPFLNVDSNAQIFVKQLHLRSEFRSFELFDDPAALHDIEPICQRRRKSEVLLDQHHGKALRPESTDDITELLHDHRRKTL